MTLLEVLWHMKRGELRHPDAGICWHLAQADIPGHLRDQVRQLMMRRWPEFSGCASYPVPCPAGGTSGDAYDVACRDSTMWVGAYGGARMRLLNWLIRQEEAAHA